MTSRPDRQDHDAEPLEAPEDNAEDDEEDRVPDLYDCLRQSPWHGAYGEPVGSPDPDGESDPEEAAPTVPWEELWPEAAWPEEAWPGGDEALLSETPTDRPDHDPQEER